MIKAKCIKEWNTSCKPAIAEMKEGKALGVDEIPAEMLNNLGNKALKEICDFCQDIYEKGK